MLHAARTPLECALYGNLRGQLLVFLVQRNNLRILTLHLIPNHLSLSLCLLSRKIVMFIKWSEI